MDIYKGSMKRVLLNTINARYFATDVNDEVRFGFETEAVGETTVHFRNPKTKKWEVLIVLPETDADWYPLDFSPDRDTFLVETDLGRDKKAIVRYNWKTGESETVYEDPFYEVDSSNLIYEIKKQDECVGLYYEADLPKAIYFDKQHEKLQAMIDKALPNTFNELLEVDDSGEKILILSSSD
jgi:hypothetical protein